MGTTKSGRYLNKSGSKTNPSDFAVCHSNEGSFGRNKNNEFTLDSGGHGQSNINLLDKYHIPYVIEKIYPNGVRIGYIKNHISFQKRTTEGQTWFPENWSENDIKQAGRKVAFAHIKEDNATFTEIVKNIRVCIIKHNGKIESIFPDRNQENIK